MEETEIEIADEISRDIKDCYDLLRDIYVELHSVRKLVEMRVLRSRRMKNQYKRERRRIESEASSRFQQASASR
jgi:hypothetical protein